MNKEVIQEFYLLALVDIANGTSIQDLEEEIYVFEQEEEYEACEGILKAIHESGYKTIKEIINNTKDENNKRD